MTRIGDEPLTVVIDGVTTQRILRHARCLRCQFVNYTKTARAGARKHASDHPGHRVVLVVTVTTVYETPKPARLTAEPEPMSGFDLRDDAEAAEFEAEQIAAPKPTPVTVADDLFETAFGWRPGGTNG